MVSYLKKCNLSRSFSLLGVVDGGGRGTVAQSIPGYQSQSRCALK